MRSHSQLKHLYRQYNRAYFDNKLPDVHIDFVTPAQMKKCGMSKSTCAITCFEKGEKPAIFISWNKFKTWGYIKADLLHEMCHVAHPKANHGRVFQNEMKRLALENAFMDIW